MLCHKNHICATSNISHCISILSTVTHCESPSCLQCEDLVSSAWMLGSALLFQNTNLYTTMPSCLTKTRKYEICYYKTTKLKLRYLTGRPSPNHRNTVHPLGNNHAISSHQLSRDCSFHLSYGGYVRVVQARACLSPVGTPRLPLMGHPRPLTTDNVCLKIIPA